MLSKIAGGIETVLSLMLYIILTVMIVSIVTQVVGRYLFSYSPSWTEEIARMSVAWITMLGSAAVIRREGHISVTVVIDALPAPLARMITFIRDCLILVMCGGLAWFGYGFAVIGGRRASPALEISMYYPFLSIPVGAVLIAVLLLLHMVDKATRAEGMS